MAARGEISNRLAERIRYPRAFWTDFSQAAARTGVKPDLLLALARQESLFDPTASSIADARGVMQLLPSTAEKVAARSGIPQSRIDLYDPSVNIELGSANVKMLLRSVQRQPVQAIAAYNARRGSRAALGRQLSRAPMTNGSKISSTPKPATM